MNLNELEKILKILDTDAEVMICVKNKYDNKIYAKIDRVVLSDTNHITLCGDDLDVEEAPF